MMMGRVVARVLGLTPTNGLWSVVRGPVLRRSAVGLVGCALLLAGCASTPTVGAADAPAGPKPPVSVTAGTSQAAPTGSVTRPPDPLAPTPLAPSGTSATIKAPQTAFMAPATYPDGLTLAVRTIDQATETGQGRGVFPGAPTTSFGLHLTNGTAAALDLSHSVVAAAYGRPPRVAQASYAGASQDFAGTLAAGASADAAYIFSIPTSELANVYLTVDIGGQHAAAIFTGPATSR